MGRGSRSARSLGAVAVVTALLLVACGGDDGPELSRADFTNKVNAECASLEEASDDFRKAQDPSATGEQVTRFLGDASARLRQLTARVEALNAPEVIEGDVDELLQLLNDYAEGLDTIGEEVGAGQTFQETLNGNGELVDRLNGYSSDVLEVVARLGLSGCVLTT